jgi:hypothetical protein
MKLWVFGLVSGILITIVVSNILRSPLLSSNAYGHFIGGNPKTEWLTNGRTMRLLEDFASPDQRIWSSPKDSIVDGASIPRVFWSFIGGPLEGKYRNASIIHDVACIEKRMPADSVHRMFYFACRCGGAPEAQAKAMYFAVAHFGPKWKLVAEKETNELGTTRTVFKPVDFTRATGPTEEEAKAAMDWFTKNIPKPDDIPKLDPSIVQSPRSRQPH